MPTSTRKYPSLHPMNTPCRDDDRPWGWTYYGAMLAADLAAIIPDLPGDDLARDAGRIAHRLRAVCAGLVGDVACESRLPARYGANAQAGDAMKIHALMDTARRMLGDGPVPPGRVKELRSMLVKAARLAGRLAAVHAPRPIARWGDCRRPLLTEWWTGALQKWA